MRIISIFLIVAFAISCKNRPTAVFEATLFLNWHAAFDLNLSGKEYLNNHKAIKRPYNTWQTLFEVSIMNDVATKSTRQCLLYRVPFNELKGVLKLVELRDKEKCGEALNFNAITILNEIDSLQIFYSPKKIFAEDKKKILPPYTIHMLVQRKGDQNWLSIPLLNIKGKRELVLFSSGERDGYSKGMIFWPYSSTKVDLNRRKSQHRYLGSLEDKYIDRKLVMCEKVNDDCSLREESQCHRCRYGWFEVVGTKCRTRRSKFCGPIHCGEKGEPACVRGDVFGGNKNEIGCFGGSDAGFCRSGLETYCDGNGILVCL